MDEEITLACGDCKHYAAFTSKSGLCQIIDMDLDVANSGKLGALADAVKPCQRSIDSIACAQWEAPF